MLELSPTITRQTIDAVAVFDVLARAPHQRPTTNTWCAPRPLDQQQRMNRALRVSRVDPLVVALLNRLAST